MKKDWILLIVSIAITLFVALGIIRWFAPQLLGLSPDLQLVQIDKKVPPFFENIFRAEDFKSQTFLIKDPILNVRAIPFYPDKGGVGPHDLLGFRNRGIPNSAKIITIGDSQTYGNNAVIEQNWPSVMVSSLKPEGATIYNMSVGGWAAPEYLSILPKAIAFKPEVVVIAYYTGNDPLGAFIQVYGNPLWRESIPDKSLSASDAPKVVFPAPKEEHWAVTFKDGVKTVFTPSLRLTSNSDHPAVHAGYKIMANFAHIIAESVADINAKVFFTIIPTKELVYAQKIAKEELVIPQDYQTLVTREKANIEQLAEQIKSYPQLNYVDVLQPLQDHAMKALLLYPEDDNGHPIAEGYKVIGNVMADVVRPFLSIEHRELVSMQVAPGQFKLFLLKDSSMYFFESFDIIEKNGWSPGKVETVTQDKITGLTFRGTINDINPALYGPLKNNNMTRN